MYMTGIPANKERGNIGTSPQKLILHIEGDKLNGTDFGKKLLKRTKRDVTKERQSEKRMGKIK